MDNIFDLVIVGAGPAGLTAAIYAARAGVKPLVLESLGVGGQVAQTVEIENYPGFLTIDGGDLSAKMREQAEHAGATVKRMSVKKLERRDGVWALTTNKGELLARAVIAATGAVRRKLGVPGEEEYSGMGVSYCATCDGGFFREREVMVVGGGSVAFDDVLYLSRICKKVTLVHRRDGFRAEETLIERVRAAENVEMKLFRTVAEIHGENGLVSAVTLHDLKGGEDETIPVSGIFVAVGTVPESAWLGGCIPLDDGGYAEVDEYCAVGGGLFVAGDLRRKPIMQIVTACADGAVAGNAAADYLNEILASSAK